MFIGNIAHLPGDKSFFAFDDAYINDSSRPTLSLSFKDINNELITQTKITTTRLSPFFSNLLPEGHLREYLAAQAQVPKEREFFLIAALGKDLPGAIKVLPANELKTTEDVNKKKEKKPHILHFSLAGIQLKFSAVLEKDGGLTVPVDGVGGSWIVKLPSPNFAGVPENEYAMMKLAKQIGIDVPEIALVNMEEIHGIPKEVGNISNHAYAIKRFDRTPDGLGIHIEDFAQIFGVYAEKKYKAASYRNIAETIWLEIGEKGLKEFIRRFVFNALIGNGDMHLKNWSFIYPDKRKAALAPAYDFVSTISYLPEDKLALSFAGSKEFPSLSMAQFKHFALKASLPEQIVLDTVIETVKEFKHAWASTERLDQNIVREINQHLKTIPIYNFHLI